MRDKNLEQGDIYGASFANRILALWHTIYQIYFLYWVGQGKIRRFFGENKKKCHCAYTEIWVRAKNFFGLANSIWL